MFWQMITVEHSKIFKRAILWIELALMALAMLLLHTGLYAVTQRSNGDRAMAAQLQQTLVWPAGLSNALDFAAGPNLGGLLMVVLVGAVTAQEYTWRTLQLWLSRGVSRPALLGAKFLALLLPALLIVLTPLLAGGAITAVFSQILLGSIPFSEVAWGQLAWSTVLTAYTLLPYAALAFCLAVLSRSAVVAVGGGLAYSFLLEGIAVQLLSLAGGVWAQIGQYLPAGLARGLLSTNAGVVVEVNNQVSQAAQYPDAGLAALGIAVYTLLLTGLALLVFQRQDLN